VSSADAASSPSAVDLAQRARPPEIDTSEDRLLANLSAAPPDLVVSVRLDLREWGSRGFGVDHGRRTWAWIRAHYEPITAFGPEDLVSVLRRRPSSH
jgi:hypothetical protein